MTPAPRGRRRGQGGQASVELALVLPVVVLLLMVIVEVSLVARDQVLVVHAAREAARVAAVGSPDHDVTAAARGTRGLDHRLVTVVILRSDHHVTVRVRYDSPVRMVPVGEVVAPVKLTATATMRLEAQEKSASRREMSEEPRHGPLN